MGQITSGIGLVSGINTAQLIEQLLQVESRPKTNLQKQIAVLNSQSTALAEINAKLLGAKNSTSALVQASTFNSTKASSSNTNVLTASSSSSASPGVYSFNVARLVSSQQTITRGFADTGASPVGAGTLSFEFGNAKLESDSDLSQLNGSTGVPRGKIRITDRSGNTAIVDLGRVLSVNDVLDTINNTTSINVVASVEGDSFKLADNTGGAGVLKVENLGTTATATALGLTTDLDADAATITGARINRVSRDSLLSAINDGNGVAVTAGADLNFTAGAATFDVELGAAKTLGDVIDAINGATGNSFITASVNADGTGLALANTSGDLLAVTGAAAGDLGVAVTNGGASVDGQRVIASLNSRLIRNIHGGSGAALGSIDITNRQGATTAVNLATATSVSDVISLINAAGTGVTASLNNAGNGLRLTDTTGGSASNLIVSGAAATSLGIDKNVAADALEGSDLQFRYITESTRLDALNGGSGITRGKFKITDSVGSSAEIDLTQGNEVTIADVLAEINSRGLQLNARVNDNGDGILIEDTGTGATAITISELGGTVARDLGLLGSAANPGDDFNGSFQKTIAIDAADTLQIVANKINDAGLGVKASIVNDGSGLNPYRLSLSGTRSGKGGGFVFDDGGLGLGATNLAEATDAVVFFGASDPAKAIAIRSGTNTLSKVIPGATIDLKSTSTGPVEVAISRDDSTITDSVKGFVDAFNSVITSLNKHDKYDPETQERGLLLGDPTVATIRQSLYNLVSSRNNDLQGQFTSLAQIGVSVGSGAVLKFDETRFANALATDREAVVKLFTFKETATDSEGVVSTTAAGVGVRFDELLQRFTDSSKGTMTTRSNSIGDSVELLNDRIEAFDQRIEAKRLRLQMQFNNMEKILSQLQTQGQALSSMALSSGTT